MVKVYSLTGFLATAVTIATLMAIPRFKWRRISRKLVRHFMTKLGLFSLLDLHNLYAKLQKNL